MYHLIFYIQYITSLTFLTCVPFNLLHSVHNIFDVFDMNYYIIFNLSAFAKEFGHPDWQGYGSFITRWTKRYGIVNKAICGSKESAAPHDELETWKEMVLVPTFASTHQMTFTMGMKLPYFTSHCHTGLTALMVTSLQALQNVKTD